MTMPSPQMIRAAQAVESANRQMIAAFKQARDAIEYYNANSLAGELPALDTDLVHNAGGAQTKRQFLDQIELLATAAKQFLDEGQVGNTLLGVPPLNRRDARESVRKLGL